MSQPYVGDIRFFHPCMFCHRNIEAATLIVMRQKLDEHEAVCGPETKKRIEAARAAAAQGDLFGKR